MEYRIKSWNKSSLFVVQMEKKFLGVSFWLDITYPNDYWWTANVYRVLSGYEPIQMDGKTIKNKFK